jgi:hypothetical protein
MFRAAFRSLATFSVTLAAGLVQAEEAHTLALNSALETISAADAREYVNALADDTFEGREAGSRGGRAAGIYIVKKLQAWGLRGGGPKGSFYQNFSSGNNILAILDGSDADLKKEFILVGAHYDHVGYGTARNSYGPTGYIHNGADDNASGVSGQLEIIEAFSKLEPRPKRSILFAFWDGEEKGLLGSKHWSENPTVSLAQIKVAFNTDMIGRLRKGRLEVLGCRTCAGFRQIVGTTNDNPAMWLDFNWEMKENSDHHSFYSKRIPILMFFTGLHGDYHRPSDDAEKINVDGIQQIAQLEFKVINQLANAPQVGSFRQASLSESPFTQKEVERALPPLPGRLGVRWQTRPNPAEAVIVEYVTPQSAAAKGGLKPGDRVVKFNDEELVGPEDLRILVQRAKNPVTLTVERPGAKEPVTLTLQLAGPPLRLGITWQESTAEPGAVILNRVTPGSPAAVGGLRLFDRIYEVAGQSFKNGEEFRQIILTSPSPVELLVESRGQVKRLSLDVPPLDEVQ